MVRYFAQSLIKGALEKKTTMVKGVALGLCLMAGAYIGPVSAQQTYTVNFNDSDIQEVIKFVADASGRTIIIDPRVKGRVKVISDKALPPDELYDLFLSVLEVHGFTAIEIGKVTRIVPRKEARSAPVPVTDNLTGVLGNEYVTQVIQLSNVAAVKVLPVLRPLVPQHAHLAAYDPSNAIIVSDTAANIARIRALIERIDKAAVSQTELVPLENAQAEEIVRILTQLEGQDQKRGRGTSQLVLVADSRTNGILVSGDDLQRDRIRELIQRLDKPREQSGNVRVVYLKYADATQIAQVVSKVVQNMGKTSGDKNAANSQATIEADEETNSLLITADVGTLPTLLEVVDKLDIRRAQVLVEAIIVEISDNVSNALGIQWLFLNGDEGILGGNSNASNDGGLLANIAAGLLDPDNTNEGDAIASVGSAIAGSAGQLFGFGKVDQNGGTSFLALVNALDNNTDTNILATPNLLTTDNHEATITVGQEVPFITGQFSSTGSGGSTGVSNPFQTIERQNVGTSLKVTPHINDGETIVLDLVQEDSSLSGASASDVITNERKIETQIVAKNGEIVVLGGMIKDDIQESSQRVPFLGSIPGLGRLFRNDTTTVRKQNLLVFIRPTIIRTDEELVGATAEKYKFIRNKQIQAREEGTDFVESENLPLLPAWKHRQQPANPAVEYPNRNNSVDATNPDGNGAPQSLIPDFKSNSGSGSGTGTDENRERRSPDAGLLPNF